MDKIDTIKLLKRIADDASLVKAVIKKEVSGGRVLVDEETKHEVESWLRTIGSDVAVAESEWSAFGRLAPNSKKFATIK